jgi:hypothetical protein
MQEDIAVIGNHAAQSGGERPQKGVLTRKNFEDQNFAKQKSKIDGPSEEPQILVREGLRAGYPVSFPRKSSKIVNLQNSCRVHKIGDSSLADRNIMAR